MNPYDHVISIAQRLNLIANSLVQRATDKAVGGRDHAEGAIRSVTERGCPRVHKGSVIPLPTADHVVAVAQCGHTIEANLIVFLIANEAVSSRDHASDAGRALAERDRTCVFHAPVVPTWTYDNEVTVIQRHHATTAHVIAG